MSCHIHFKGAQLHKIQSKCSFNASKAIGELIAHKLIKAYILSINYRKFTGIFKNTQ